MIFLLDTNVWRYLVDSKECSKLYAHSKSMGVKIAVCPSTVIETLKIRDTSLRNSIVELQTRTCWQRLLPDAYLQCEELKKELLRLHPSWRLEHCDTVRYNKLLKDWTKKEKGWWHAARYKTQETADFYHKLDHENLSEARSQARQLRADVISSKQPMVQGALSDHLGSFRLADGTRLERESWRVYAAHVWANMLRQQSPMRQWLSCDLNLDLILYRRIGEFRKFWYDDAELSALRRSWLLASFYLLQADKKVTDGTPVDQAIATHLIDVDIFVSADRNMVEMANRCRREAPFETASAVLIGAGSSGVAELYQHIASALSRINERT